MSLLVLVVVVLRRRRRLLMQRLLLLLLWWRLWRGRGSGLGSWRRFGVSARRGGGAGRRWRGRRLLRRRCLDRLRRRLLRPLLRPLLLVARRTGATGFRLLALRGFLRPTLARTARS